jgi:hypothetical protein
MANADSNLCQQRRGETPSDEGRQWASALCSPFERTPVTARKHAEIDHG